MKALTSKCIHTDINLNATITNITSILAILQLTTIIVTTMITARLQHNSNTNKNNNSSSNKNKNNNNNSNNNNTNDNDNDNDSASDNDNNGSKNNNKLGGHQLPMIAHMNT